jgi:predicted RNA-binding protein associated with RNAse of E/G family
VADGLVSDFDFHPDELYVRQFRVRPGDVLRRDAAAFVSEVESDGVVLRHYAFAGEWFKVNVTFDRAGSLVDTPAEEGVRRPFAFNCDIATPMLTQPDGVYAVDLFLDVLVGADARTFDVVDADEFEEAIAAELLSPHEVEGARRGLRRLIGLIERGEFVDFLEAACPFGASTAGPALPILRVPIADGPFLGPGVRPTWR